MISYQILVNLALRLFFLYMTTQCLRKKDLILSTRVEQLRNFLRQDTICVKSSFSFTNVVRKSSYNRSCYTDLWYRLWREEAMTHPHLVLWCHLSLVKLLYSQSLPPSVAFDLVALSAVISTVLLMASLSINKLSSC